MRIKRNKLPRRTLSQFATEHKLTMVIDEEYDLSVQTLRYSAYFDNVRLVDGKGSFIQKGTGYCELYAMKAYAKLISDQHIRIIHEDGTFVRTTAPYLEHDDMLPF